jgi:hypothetical protein
MVANQLPHDRVLTSGPRDAPSWWALQLMEMPFGAPPFGHSWLKFYFSSLFIAPIQKGGGQLSCTSSLRLSLTCRERSRRNYVTPEGLLDVAVQTYEVVLRAPV